MAFTAMSEPQYRSLTLEALEERRAAIEAAYDDAEVSTETLAAESELCIAEFERRSQKAALRGARIAAVMGGAGNGIAKDAQQAAPRTNDPLDTEEYRSAFFEYLATGNRNGILLRDDPAPATPSGMLTTDAPVAIPTTLSTDVIEKLDTVDDLYALTTKTNFQGGVEIPIDEFDFTASWVEEEEVTDWQKAERKKKIVFAYHEFEARVMWSWLSGIVTLDSFRAKFQPKLAKSITRLLVDAMFNGTGEGMPLGIFNDERVTNVIEMTAEQFADWQTWHSVFDAAIDPDYDDGSLIMAKSTWNKYIDTMADDNKAPVNYTYNPVSGKREQHLVGKETRLVKATTLPDFDTADAGDVVAVYGDLKNYVFNWQPNGHISIMRYPDYDKRKNKMLAYGVCDGKVADPYGFYLIKKKASA